MEKEKCLNFLKLNGWEIDEIDDEYIHLDNQNSISIDMNDNEIVLIDDNGDFTTLPVYYYYLVGYFYVNRIVNLIFY